MLEMKPPDSFGSANSRAAPGSFYQFSFKNSEGRTSPKGGGAEPSMDSAFHREMIEELRRVKASNEELTRAVRELQDSAAHLEDRVSELESSWQEADQENDDYFEQMRGDEYV